MGHFSIQPSSNGHSRVQKRHDLVRLIRPDATVLGT
jgi:hypothetical protein